MASTVYQSEGDRSVPSCLRVADGLRETTLFVDRIQWPENCLEMKH